MGNAIAHSAMIGVQPVFSSITRPTCSGNMATPGRSRFLLAATGLICVVGLAFSTETVRRVAR